MLLKKVTVVDIVFLLVQAVNIFSEWHRRGVDALVPWVPLAGGPVVELACGRCRPCSLESASEPPHVPVFLFPGRRSEPRFLPQQLNSEGVRRDHDDHWDVEGD